MTHGMLGEVADNLVQPFFASSDARNGSQTTLEWPHEARTAVRIGGCLSPLNSTTPNTLQFAILISVSWPSKPTHTKKNAAN